jgi:hypothetical protein
MRLLGFLVLELAVIHQTADRRLGLRRDLDEIDSGFLGHRERLSRGHNAKRFVLNSYQAHFGDADFPVQTQRRLFLSDGDFSER